MNHGAALWVESAARRADPPVPTSAVARAQRLPGAFRRAALAIAAGLLLFAGHPPVDLILAGPLALVPLLILARDIAGDGEHRVRTAALWGLLAGTIFFAALLTWIEPLGVLPWLLLALSQGLWVAAFVAGVVAWGDRPWRPVMAVVWWVALEALRSHLPFGGFGWGLLGYTQHGGGILLPVARALGVLGVSAACAAVAVGVEELLHRVAVLWRSREAAGSSPARAPSLVGVPVVGIAAVLTVAVVLGGSPPAVSGGTVDIASVQASDLRYTSAAIATRLDSDRIVHVTEQVVEATRPLADDPPEIAIWPENSLDADITLAENVRIRELLAEGLALLNGRPLLANGIRRGPRPNTDYNEVYLIGADGEIQDTYTKRRPVPFGEYIPFRSLFDWYPALDQVSNDRLPGDGPEVIEVADAQVGPVICFENLFADVVHDQVRAGADVLVVSTNNTTFAAALIDDSAMSRQHLAISELRAVETGRWIVHAGVSGISAFVDPHGRVSQQTEILEAGVIRTDVPLIEGRTLATRLGALLTYALWALSAAGLAFLTMDHRRRQRRTGRR